MSLPVAAALWEQTWETVKQHEGSSQGEWAGNGAWGHMTNSPTTVLCDFGETAFIGGESHAAGRCEFGSIYGKQ